MEKSPEGRRKYFGAQLTAHSSQLTPHSSVVFFLAPHNFFSVLLLAGLFFQTNFLCMNCHPTPPPPLRLFRVVHPLHRERANEANKMLRKDDYSPSSFKHITQTRLDMIMKEKKQAYRDTFKSFILLAIIRKDCQLKIANIAEPIFKLPCSSSTVSLVLFFSYFSRGLISSGNGCH